MKEDMNDIFKRYLDSKNKKNEKEDKVSVKKTEESSKEEVKNVKSGEDKQNLTDYFKNIKKAEKSSTTAEVKDDKSEKEKTKVETTKSTKKEDVVYEEPEDDEKNKKPKKKKSFWSIFSKVLIGIVVASIIGVIVFFTQFTKITVESENVPQSAVSGGGIFKNGSTIKLKAGSVEGYVFVSWRYNGEEISVDPEISIVVGGETKGTYTAYYEPIVYSIKKETSSNGSFYISHSPNVGNEDETNSGIINDTVYLNVVPVEGYEQSKAYYIVEGDIKQHLITDNKFTMPAGNVKIFVEFKLKEYNIQKVSENGSFTVSGKTTMGEKVTIQPVADTGYEFDNAYYINANDGKKYTIKDNSFVMPASDITIYVEFRFIDYVITNGTSTNGTFTVSGKPNIGQTITINPQPSAGYKFARAYYVESGSEDKKYITGTTFEMPANNITVYVEFETISYTISKEENLGGDFTYSGTPTIGQTITISNITPSEGYTVGKVYYKVNGTGPEIQINDNRFTMPANNVTIGVHFVAIDYTISKAPTTSGDFSFSGTPNVGQTITITPQPNTGFRVDSVVVTSENKGGIDVVNNGETYTFTMPADNVTINVSFVNIVYNITTNDSQNGSYTIEGNKTTAIYGEEIKLNITPELGFKVSAAYFVDSQNKRTELDISDIESGNLTFTMPANNISIFVEFVAIDYDISSECDGGKVYVNSTAKYKETVNFSIVLNGAKLIDVKVLNSLNQEIEVTNINANNYSFTMPADNVTIVVSVEQFIFAYSSDDTLGSVEVSGGSQIGDEVTLTFNFAEGKEVEFIGWTEDEAKGWAQNSDLNLLEQDVKNPLQYKFVLESFEPKTIYAVCNPLGEDGVGVYSKINYYRLGETSGISNCDFDGTNLIVPIAVNLNNNYKLVDLISEYAFSTLRNLEKVVLPNSITSIGKSAFLDCSGLKNINIPSGLTVIENATFQRCSSLTSIIVPNSVIRIGDSAFNGCGLTSITLPFIGRSASMLDKFSTIFGTSVAVPSTLKEVIISEGTQRIISAYAFSGCKYITTIKLPNTITQIQNYAFSGCVNLTDINIPDSVEEIRDYVFNNCSSLTSVDIPNNGLKLYDNAFANWTGLTNIRIPDSITQLSDYLFSGCVNLKNIDLPETLTGFGNGVFQNCDSLNTITIPNNVKKIDYEAFKDWTGLTSITIPESVENIGSYAFSGCINLTNITIPNSVNYVYDYAFEDCKALTEITLPNKLQSISDYLFAGCTSLKNIVIPSNVWQIGYKSFVGCTSLTSITIPTSVRKIKDYAFNNCSNLNSVIFKDSYSWSADSNFISSADLSNPETAANYLTDEYCSCEWIK